MIRTSDYRARMHPGYWAFAVHRVSGLALAVFLPVHFWALGLGLQGEAALDGFLRVTDNAMFRLGEWGLVVLLAAHLTCGVRLLLIEFAPWSGPRKNLIAWAMGGAIAVGLAFALALIG
ncbi:MAG TPA: succinate dehydrogenase, cytochrome b556 subunit [Casimicrobiaceae bacterium]|nr:succinate dehydrogenase, cytochrome b556 subunit [Casimicrobiaceae bacterium]